MLAEPDFNDFCSYIFWEDQGVDLFFQKVVCPPRSVHGILGIILTEETSTEQGVETPGGGRPFKII